jgi:hypothetical protein
LPPALNLSNTSVGYRRRIALYTCRGRRVTDGARRRRGSNGPTRSKQREKGKEERSQGSLMWHGNGGRDLSDPNGKTCSKQRERKSNKGSLLSDQAWRRRSTWNMGPV